MLYIIYKIQNYKICFRKIAKLPVGLAACFHHIEIPCILRQSLT